MTPSPIQNVVTVTTPWMSGPTAIWPIDPPSMPKHCVKPMAVASFFAENPCEAKIHGAEQ